MQCITNRHYFYFISLANIKILAVIFYIKNRKQNAFKVYSYKSIGCVYNDIREFKIFKTIRNYFKYLLACVHHVYAYLQIILHIKKVKKELGNCIMFKDIYNITKFEVLKNCKDDILFK